MHLNLNLVLVCNSQACIIAFNVSCKVLVLILTSRIKLQAGEVDPCGYVGRGTFNSFSEHVAEALF